MIESPDFLPLGSIVTLQGNEAKRLMVIGRAFAVNHDESTEYYDYALVLYPEGLMGDSIVYSNHDCVTEVAFWGFADEEDADFLVNLREALNHAEGIPKARPQDKDLW